MLCRWVHFPLWNSWNGASGCGAKVLGTDPVSAGLRRDPCLAGAKDSRVPQLAPRSLYLLWEHRRVKHTKLELSNTCCICKRLNFSKCCLLMKMLWEVLPERHLPAPWRLRISDFWGMPKHRNACACSATSFLRPEISSIEKLQTQKIIGLQIHIFSEFGGIIICISTSIFSNQILRRNYFEKFRIKL